MPISQSNSSELRLVHNALTPHFMSKLRVPQVEYSLEFLDFIVRWGNGQIGNTEHHKKWYEVVTRGSCYKDALINELSELTFAGDIVFEDAKAISREIMEYYHSEGEKQPTPNNPNQAKALWEIIVSGSISMGSMKFLKQLYLLDLNTKDTPDVNPKIRLYTQIAQTTQTSPSDPQWESYPFMDNITDPKNPKTKYCFLTSALRTTPKDRAYLENLIRYGFARIVHLPRFSSQKGRGRPPVGVAIDPWGIRFFELYLEQFDRQVVKDREAKESYIEYKLEKDREEARMNQDRSENEQNNLGS